MSNLDWALQYAGRGWRVFPIFEIERGGVCACHLKCSSPGKHPRTKNGLLDATSDPDQIERWWDEWPDANIGIATGSSSGIWVLDIDNALSIDVGGGRLVSEGEHSLSELEREFDALSPTLTQRTGSGGRHLVYQYPAFGEWRNRTKVAPSVDVRGEGGYVVVPPSNHVSGQPYEWESYLATLAEAPGWLLDLAGQNRPSLEFQPGEKVGPGQRNDFLFRRGSKLRGVNRLEGIELLGALYQVNLDYCDPPLEYEEVKHIAQSAASQDVNEEEPVWVGSSMPAPLPRLAEGEDLAISLYDLMQKEIEQPIKLVDPLIDGGSGIILGGQPNVGKSWIGFSLGLSVATGKPWMGTFPTTQGKVLYIDEEAAEWAIQKRLAWLTDGMGIGSIRDVELWLKYGAGYKLDTMKGLTAVQRLISRHNPDLVVIDSLVRVHSGDENSSGDMSRFFAISKKLMQSTGAAFLFTHHVRKPSLLDSQDPGDMLRGSSDIRAWPDTVLIVMPMEQKGEVVVHHTKGRDSDKLDPFLVKIRISDNERTARLEYGGAVSKSGANAGASGGSILGAIESIRGRGEEATVAAIAVEVGKTAQTISQHIKTLFEAGRIERFWTLHHGKSIAAYEIKGQHD